MGIYVHLVNSDTFVKLIKVLFFLCPNPHFSKVYLGSHASYGEDGIEVVAERAIGRDDYGQPQFRKRSNMRQPRAQPLGGGGGRPSRGPISLWHSLFGGGGRQFNRRYRQKPPRKTTPKNRYVRK